MKRRYQLSKPAAPAVLACLLVAACATLIDEHKPAPIGWPQDIQIRDNVVSVWEVQKRCYHAVPLGWKLLGGFAMACGEVNFVNNTCDIWRVYDASPELIEHERQHCMGKSHPGETWAEDALQNHLANMRGR